jgi:hypothetical protein
MKSINLKGAIGKAFLAFSLLFGIGIMSSTSAQAQWQDNRSYDNRDRDYRNSQDRDQDRDGRRDRNGRWGRRNGRNDDGYGNYGGSFDLRQTALNAGANDGIKAGREDRRRNRRDDPSSHSEYQKATHDYSSRLGDRYIYQRYYREAFTHGYADGYAGY